MEGTLHLFSIVIKFLIHVYLALENGGMNSSGMMNPYSMLNSMGMSAFAGLPGGLGGQMAGQMGGQLTNMSGMTPGI